MSRLGGMAASLAFFLVGCTLGDGGHEVAGTTVELEHRTSVSAAAWEWEAPGSSPSAVFSVPGGVVVLRGDGAVALSGETGEEIWKYQDPERETLGNVSDDGRYVVLQTGDVDGTELLVLDSGTGEVVYEQPFDRFGAEIVERVAEMSQLQGSLSGVTSDLWVVREESGVVARRLTSEGTLWSVAAKELARCEGVGSVDELAVLDEVVVAAVTCYEQPEDKDPVR